MADSAANYAMDTRASQQTLAPSERGLLQLLDTFLESDIACWIESSTALRDLGQHHTRLQELTPEIRAQLALGRQQPRMRVHEGNSVQRIGDPLGIHAIPAKEAAYAAVVTVVGKVQHQHGLGSAQVIFVQTDGDGIS